MKLTYKDLIATVLILAIGVWYVGYLLNGSMPFVEDPRGMSVIGLVLGTAAFLIMRLGDTFGRYEKVTTAIAIVASGSSSRKSDSSRNAVIC